MLEFERIHGEAETTQSCGIETHTLRGTLSFNQEWDGDPTLITAHSANSTEHAYIGLDSYYISDSLKDASWYPPGAARMTVSNRRFSTFGELENGGHLGAENGVVEEIRVDYTLEKMVRAGEHEIRIVLVNYCYE